MKRVIKQIGAFFLDIIETVVLALAIFVLVYLFLVQPHQVRGNSMYPTFHDGEYLLTDKLSYRLGEPGRGDVIVFQAPQNQEYDYIKRIIGLPGDRVKIKNSQVYINGELLDESYLPEDFTTSGGSFLSEDEEVVIPEGEYLVLGDNRSHSSDSREWGDVPIENIIGKALFRYWPLNKLGLVGN
jgi:signal peptidase I